jgi:4-hydroxyproline epimerase
LNSHRREIQVVDSHTAGEPTRVVIAGGPHLPRGALREQLAHLRVEHDSFRSAVVNEPRGSDSLVGALPCESPDPSCCMGVMFFNNVGYLGMCGHGAIGLITTFAYLNRLQPGTHRLDTPAGSVTTRLHDSGAVTVRNVASFRSQANVSMHVEGYGSIVGDVAWGGNWFFLVHDHGQELTLANRARLTDFSQKIRRALARNGVTGDDGQEIDHIELFGPSVSADSKNFVLCPGGAYDRSPCGTGTSATLACLVADGKFRPGDVWRQESIVGTVFEGSVEIVNGEIHPSITGSAYIVGVAQLILDEQDPFCWGIRH